MPPLPSTSSPQLSKPKSALDVVVNQLVRASIGGVPTSLPDQDLDKYVADLILKEAAAKNKKFNKEGIRAYLPHTGVPPCNLPKANKRFLFNVVKSVDDHNQALIRKEEEAARKQAEEYNRYSRRRSLMDDDPRHKKRDHRTDESYQNDDYRRERSKRMRVDEIDRSRSRSNSEKRRNSPHYDYSDHDSYRRSSSEREQHHKRKRGDRFSRSLSPNISPSNITDTDKKSQQTHSKLTSLSRKQPHTEEKQSLREISKLETSSPTPSTLITVKGRGEVSNGSKMDKYFQKDYDPMLDVEPFLGENGWVIDYVQFEKMYQNNESHSECEAKKVKKKKKHRDKKEKSKHKKKKHHKSSNGTSKSKHKRRTHSTSNSEDESSTAESSKTSDVESSKEDRKRRWESASISESKLKKNVREWDIPKLTSGSWDPVG